MPRFESRDPHFEERVRESFARQTLMETIGARLSLVSPGEVEIDLPYRKDLSQQHGYLHAGVVTAIVDTACGYSALTLMEAGADVLTVEYKINFVSPARGERLVARGRVTRPGRTVTVCAGDVYAVSEGEEKLVASMLATMISLKGEPAA
ncbi:MAG TPA: PaaI family thioesterase [Blastocatellia bacterium]|nr:PaaI family thioesterase [Blastocatellia bacterium]